jgi:hypothetical protein
MANISPRAREAGQDVLDSTFELLLMTEDGMDVRFDLDVVSVTILSMTLQSVLTSTLNEAKAAHPDRFRQSNPFDSGAEE